MESTTSSTQNAHSDTKNGFSRSFHRVNFKVICKYVMLIIANYIKNILIQFFVHAFLLGPGSLCSNRKMYKYSYMHETDENQVTHLFVFNTRVVSIS